MFTPLELVEFTHAASDWDSFEYSNDDIGASALLVRALSYFACALKKRLT